MNMINRAWLFAGVLASAASAGAAASTPVVPVAASEKIQVGTGRVAISFGSGRRFFLTDQTTITERGVAVDAEQLIQVGTGRVARFTVAADVDDGITNGTLLSIEFGPQMRGPVTGVDPLTVFSYPITVTSATLLDDVPGNDVSNLQTDDEVELSGFSDADGGFQATGLELEDEPLEEWVITGPVTDIGADSFSIGSQTIAFNGIMPDDCEGGFTVGKLVQVEAAPDPAFVFGAVLTTAADIDCEIDELGGEPGAVVPAFIEGFITNVGQDNTFTVGGQTVLITESTQFEDGDPADVVVGVRVQVEGLLNTDTNVLNAGAVDFEALRFEARGPISPADIVDGVVSIFGITILTTPQTKDEDNLLAGIASPIQVDIRAFVDTEGNVYADEIKDEGVADESKVSLRGAVQSINRPEFTVLGVTVDTSTSLLMLDEDQGGGGIDADAFFSLIQPGFEIEIEDGQYDAAGRVISGGVIEIEQEQGDTKGAAAGQTGGKGMNEFGLGVGVVIESGDGLLSSSFE